MRKIVGSNRVFLRFVFFVFFSGCAPDRRVPDELMDFYFDYRVIEEEFYYLIFNELLDGDNIKDLFFKKWVEGDFGEAKRYEGFYFYIPESLGREIDLSKKPVLIFKNSKWRNEDVVVFRFGKAPYYVNRELFIDLMEFDDFFCVKSIDGIPILVHFDNCVEDFEHP